MTYEPNNHLPGRKIRLEDLVSKPKIVGYFSVDGQRNYLPDCSRLLYYKPPTTNNVHFDLNKGIESAVRRADDEDGRISHLLEWIKLNHTSIQAPGSRTWIEPKFACSCGLLATIMCSRYKPQFGWIVCAAKWKGTIYMCVFSTPEEIQNEAKMPPKFCSWGYKFEQYILSETPGKDPDTSKPVIEPAEFRCMLLRRFGKHSVLFTAEVDGINSKSLLKDPLPLNDLRFVELKTVRKIETYKQDLIFRKYKLVRWWAQSFLVDNEKILCGFRDDNGIVRNLKSYRLPELVDMSKQFWDPVSCVSDCQDFLNHVAKVVVNDCDTTIYKFEKKPYDVVFMEQLSPDSEYAFVPRSFMASTR